MSIHVERSIFWTLLVVLLFFVLAIGIVLISPRFIDASWMSPTSHYQVQLYEEVDPHLYISLSVSKKNEPHRVQHVFNGKTLFGFQEKKGFAIEADSDLEPYITKEGEPLQLTRRLLLLRKKEEGVFELYDPNMQEAFICCIEGGNLENWAQEGKFFGEEVDPLQGTLYIKNPFEFRVKEIEAPNGKGFVYDPNGSPIASLKELTQKPFFFKSRKSLIEEGEQIYAIEGCWYCHTDQNRTLVQDTVLNGTDTYPAPPSSANEYIYQQVSFPGTRRIGPDISREGVKRPSRDWHKSHFWSPKTIIPGSIMPSFRHFFYPEDHPVDTEPGIPNGEFEAIYQYMMTKGTRLTPPTEVWWQGKDPVKTKELIEAHNGR